MKKKLNEGQLVFLPSDSVLLQFSERAYSKPRQSSNINPAVQKFHKIASPTHVLFLEYEEETPYCVVLYNGERWLATKKDIYPLEVNNGC